MQLKIVLVKTGSGPGVPGYKDVLGYQHLTVV